MEKLAILPASSDGSDSATRASISAALCGASIDTTPSVQVGVASSMAGGSLVPATPGRACSCGVPLRSRFHSAATRGFKVSRTAANSASASSKVVSNDR